MNSKGVVLVISMIVMAILLVLTGVYFSGLMTEKMSVDTERFVLQALGLAEAGTSHALSELNERVTGDLDEFGKPKGAKGRVGQQRQSNIFKQYVTNNDALGFLRDFAYGEGENKFSVADNKATLVVSNADLYATPDKKDKYKYSATITVTASEAPKECLACVKGCTTCEKCDTYCFFYNYTIESVGEITRVSPPISKDIKLLQGSFIITVLRDNFAKYALFTSHHGAPSGTTVWFTEKTNFTGPVHTNTYFNFANNPSAHFTEIVTQHGQKAGFYHSRWLLDADSYPPYDVPIFDKGFERGYDEVVLPPSVTQADLKKEALGGTSEPGNGIWIPNDGTNVIGGIYIRGNPGTRQQDHADDAIINMGVGANGPVYTLTQDSTTKVVTVDYTQTLEYPNGKTEVQTGTEVETYKGIPDGQSSEGILIYTNDDVKGFFGTVEKNSAVTVSAERDIVITNHVKYQEYSPDPLNAKGYNNLLGILSWGGNIRIGTAAPNDINIHGVVMAPHGIFTVDNYNWGSPRGTATLLGGAITDFYGPFGTFSGTTQISGYGRNFVYDARMLEGMVPPYFPYMANYTSNTSPSDAFLYKKLTWQDKGR